MAQRLDLADELLVVGEADPDRLRIDARFRRIASQVFVVVHRSTSAVPPDVTQLLLSWSGGDREAFDQVGDFVRTGGHNDW